jgi:hypothetical protein
MIRELSFSRGFSPPASIVKPLNKQLSIILHRESA